MTPKKTIAGISATALLMGGVDASVLAETPLERVETIANEHVEAKQVGNVVETTLPWKGETGLKVKYDMGEPTLLEKVKDKRTKEVVTEKVDFGDGGFKVDILLNEKPNTNVFCYQIEGAENYDFFYQPPLTAEEIAEGAERPEEIEGSFAVYHKTLKNHRIGGENYATGKVMHIPRPQVWELNNEESTKEWADLSYSEQDGLCVTARQEFLDKATYPVRIDPTFGYTTAGGTELNDYYSAIAAISNLVNQLTASTGDTITSYSLYGRTSTSNSTTISFSAYTVVAGSPSARLASPVTVSVSSTTLQWWNSSTVSQSLSNGTIYCNAFSSQGSGFGTDIFYDNGSAPGRINSTLTTLGDPFSPTGTDSGRHYSTYATYTASGGSATTSDEIFWFE